MLGPFDGQQKARNSGTGHGPLLLALVGARSSGSGTRPTLNLSAVTATHRDSRLGAPTEKTHLGQGAKSESKRKLQVSRSALRVLPGGMLCCVEVQESDWG